MAHRNGFPWMWTKTVVAGSSLSIPQCIRPSFVLTTAIPFTSRLSRLTAPDP